MPDRRLHLGVRRALLSPVLLAVAVAACGSSVPSATPVAPSPVVSPSGASPSVAVSPSASASLPASTEPTISAPPQPGSQEVTPSSPPKEVGAVEAVTVFTHCGFTGQLDWAGSFWQEAGREPEGGPIGDPEDTGRITLINPTQARFESSTGTVVVLERLDGPVTLQPCD